MSGVRRGDIGNSDDDPSPKTGVGKTDNLMKIMKEIDEETDDESDPEFVDPKDDDQDDPDRIG